MDYQIGDYDPVTRTVPVTFTYGEHEPWTRPLNAVLDEEGEYDAEATAARAEELAPGVEYKFAMGLLPPAPPPDEPVFEPESSEEEGQ